MDVAFGDERVAEQDLLLEILDAAKPAFPVLADRTAPIEGLQNGRALVRQVTVDEREHGEWVAADHDELGIVLARRAPGHGALLVWPGGDLPSGRDGGPRLVNVIEGLVDRLARHAAGNGPRRRREATDMAERLKAIRVLIRPR
jgi:hypothetical protein